MIGIVACPFGGVVSEVVIPAATGTIIGLYDFGGAVSQAKAFDGVTNSTPANSAVDDANDSWLGKQFGVGKAITRVVTHGTSNAGYSGYGPSVFPNVDVTIKLRASNTLPTGRTDGTLLGSISFVELQNESVGREIVSSDTWTKYAYVWVDTSREFTSPITISTYLAEVIFYENVNT